MAIPSSVEDLTAGWLSEQLGKRVDSVNAERIGRGEGFVGILARLHLSGAPDLPKTLIAKLPTDDPGGQFIGQLLRLWERESRWYAEVAPHVSIRIPRCYVNLADPGTHQYALVLEDLAPARSYDQVTGATAEQSRAVVERIGLLHAQWWQHPKLAEFTWMPKINDATTKSVTPMFEAGYPAFLDRYKDRLPARTFGWIEQFGPSAADFLDLYVDEPCTMIHGDFRLDNMMFSDDGELALVDWQMSTERAGPVRHCVLPGDEPRSGGAAIG